MRADELDELRLGIPLCQKVIAIFSTHAIPELAR